jgi:hypothetical protein
MRDERPLSAHLLAFLDAGARPRHRRAHDGLAATTEALSTALKAVLTDQVRARASSVAATIRTDGVSVTATLLMTALSR